MARKTSNRRSEKETITNADVAEVNASELVGNSDPASTTEERAAESAGSANGGENVTPNASILVLKGTNKSGKTAAYTIPGQVGSVRVAKSAITNETFPQSFADIAFKAADPARAEKQAQKSARKENRAQSAAERATKLEQRIAKATQAAEKNRLKLEKLRAKAPVSAQEQTEGAVAQAEAGGVTEVAQEAAV
jgi:predicted ribosome quality control (RQC) complex YloA/Tae2 family protein